MKIVLAIAVLFCSLNVFAGPAMCGKYSAVIVATNEKVTITSQVSEYVNDADFTGYATIITNVVGKDELKISCRKFFTGSKGDKICDIVAVKKVALISNEDCWSDEAL